MVHVFCFYSLAKDRDHTMKVALTEEEQRYVHHNYCAKNLQNLDAYWLSFLFKNGFVGRINRP